MAKKRQKFLEYVRDTKEVRRILVVRNGLIGDTVFITPVIDRLHETFPNAKLDAALSRKGSPILESDKRIDKIHVIPGGLSVWEHALFFLSLRRYRYDIVVLQESNPHYALMAKLVGAKFIAGLGSKLSWIMDYYVPWSQGVHAVLAELEVVKEWTVATHSTAPRVVVTQAEAEQAVQILKENGIDEIRNLICFHPSCSRANSQKEWVPEYYAIVADLLIKNHGAHVVFTGILQDNPLIEKIMSAMQRKAVSLVGKTTLRQFAGLMSLSSILVGPDTGTLHLATAIGTPVVMLLGPTDPIDTGPFDPSGRSKVLHAELPCIGCSLRSPKPAQWEVCKDLHPVICMEKLTPDYVYKQIIDTLGWKSST